MQKPLTNNLLTWLRKKICESNVHLKDPKCLRRGYFSLVPIALKATRDCCLIDFSRGVFIQSSCEQSLFSACFGEDSEGNFKEPVHSLIPLLAMAVSSTLQRAIFISSQKSLMTPICYSYRRINMTWKKVGTYRGSKKWKWQPQFVQSKPHLFDGLRFHKLQISQ